jgi:endonuclease/exonuclease/phosphatase family metal-dependent hydrolase
MNRRAFLRSSAVLASLTPAVLADDPPRRNDDAVESLRVLTYNLHHGEGIDGRLDLPRIAKVIRDARPDLVALQEIDRLAKRTGSVDQAAEYARLTGLHGWYGAAMPFQGGEYGQSLLSRWPLVEPRVVRLPGKAGREPRIAVTAKVEVPGIGMIRWSGLHLDASREDDDRWEQAGALLREFGPEGIPGLMAGDFNATPESRVMQRLLGPDSPWADTAGKDQAAPTIPAEAPRSRIDFILGTPRGAWRTVESRVIPEAVASDHRPVLAVLRLVRK